MKSSLHRSLKIFSLDQAVIRPILLVGEILHVSPLYHKYKEVASD